MTTEYRDLLERLVATFVETFLAALVITDLSTASTGQSRCETASDQQVTCVCDRG
jgi:hypothetical protein